MEQAPEYFLLDTNTFIDYTKENKDDYFIDHIIRFIEDNRIHLLVPDVLLTEWKEKKEKTLDNISKAISCITNISANDFTNEAVKSNYQQAQAKAEAIDRLLAQGIAIKTPSKVMVETIKRSINHKAPFHGNKTKSINDALIYFTAVYYLKKNKIRRFVFITKDASDFGLPENKNEVLHPDLADPSIHTLYCTSLFKCFDKLKDIFTFNKAEKEIPYQLIISKKGTKNMLDHLYDVIKVYRSKINFLPTFILSKLEPFRVSDFRQDYAYHSGTTLLTNNKLLVEFFRQIDIKKMRFKAGAEFRNTKANLEKLEYIISCLNQNMVFHISYVTGGETIHIHKDPDINCQCSFCTYRRLSFDKTLIAVYEDKDELRRAFVLFQLGRFNESLLIYYNIYQSAVRQDNKVLVYRILLVLHWIVQYAEYQPDHLRDQVLIDKIKPIDREKAFLAVLHGSKLDKEIALFFHGTTMMDYYKLAIKETVEKIREHYLSQLKAHYSSNSNYENLVNEFLGLEMFTIYNGMAYTRYSDFKNICDDFTEGVFMCIALNDYQSSRIDYLDDYLLEKLLIYGNADRMIRQFNRFVKKQLPYRSDNKAFEKLALNFLNTDTQTINQFIDANFYEGNSFFYRIFWNLLLLLAIVDFDEAFVITCTSKIIKFLDKIPRRETHQLNHLASLIHSKGKVLKKKVLQPLFKFILANPSLHNDELLNLITMPDGYNFKMDLTATEFNGLCTFFLQKCEKCGEYHKNTLLHMFPLLSKKYQVELSSKICDQLSSNFDADLYYLAVMADIIEFNTFFKQYLALFNKPEKSRQSFYHLNGEIQYRYLSNLMNLVFKTKTKLHASLKDQFMGLSDYYDWVLDMRRFDYSKFKAIWIIQYATRYYLEEAFSIEQVRHSVRSFLKENHQPTLAYYYTQYVR